MCHHVHVTLSAEDKAAAKKISGFLIPAYAMAALALVALVTASGAPRQTELAAAASSPAATR